VPSQTFTISEARNKLTELALDVLESTGALDAGPRSQAFGELRAAMEVRVGKDGGINGGNEGSDWVKYMSEWPRIEDCAEHHSQAGTTERDSRHGECGDNPFAL
jgi:hypothetical protein